MYKVYYGFYPDLPDMIKRLEVRIKKLTGAKKIKEIKKKIKEAKESIEEGKKSSLITLMKSEPSNFEHVRGKISAMVDSLGTAPNQGSRDLLEKIKKDLKLIYTDIKEVQKKKRHGKKSERDFNSVSVKTQKRKLNDLNFQIEQALMKVDTGMVKADRKLSLGVSIDGFSSAADQLNITLAGCSTGCEHFTPVPIDESVHHDKTVSSCDRPYEIAKTINLESVNNYLASLFPNGGFDICSSSQKYKVCENADFLSIQNNIKLAEPPYIGWDEGEKSFQLVIPRVVRESDIGPIPGYFYCNRDATSIKLKFKPVVTNEGTTIGIEGLEDVESRVKFDAKSALCKVVVGAVMPIAGLALAAVHGGLQALILKVINGDIKDTLEEGVDIPPEAPISNVVCIDGSKNHITIYSNLKEGSTEQKTAP